jgi:hypothetical protein
MISIDTADDVERDLQRLSVPQHLINFDGKSFSQTIKDYTKLLVSQKDSLYVCQMCESIYLPLWHTGASPIRRGRFGLEDVLRMFYQNRGFKKTM